MSDAIRSPSEQFEIHSEASRRKCLLLAVSICRLDLPLIEDVIRLTASALPQWELPKHLPTLPAAIDIFERVADDPTNVEDEERAREAWDVCKEAAVMDQDFELATYFRDIRDILRGSNPDFPSRPPYHVQAARVLSRGSLAGHSAFHNHRAGQERTSAEQQAIASRRTIYSRYLTDMFGPVSVAAFSPDWRTDTAVSLARTMYESRDFSAMPILADALQDAGCDNDDLLNHCRDPKQVHVRGCWVVDLVLGKGVTIH